MLAQWSHSLLPSSGLARSLVAARCSYRQRTGKGASRGRYPGGHRALPPCSPVSRIRRPEASPHGRGRQALRMHRRATYAMAKKDDGPRKFRPTIPAGDMDRQAAEGNSPAGDMEKDAVPKPGYSPVELRWGVRNDFPALVSIDRMSYCTPWNEKDFIDASRRQDTVIMLAERNDITCGYIIYRLRKKIVEVVRIAADPPRQGIGTQLMRQVQRKLSTPKYSKVIIAAPDDSLGCHLFLKSLGFWATRIEGKNYIFVY